MAGQTPLANGAREALVDLLLERGRVAEAVPISEAALRSQEAGAADRDRSLELLERHARSSRWPATTPPPATAGARS